MLHIRIPATSANLGAGFDALGLAVTLYNEVSVEESDRIEILSSDGVPVPIDSSNLIYSTVEQLYKECGKRLGGLKIEQVNRIPMTRGLGSSSACIVAGLLAGNRMLGNPYGVDDLVDRAAQIEGHPDNTTPALLGGIVTSVFDGKKVHYVRQEVDSRLRFVAVVPDFELKTSVARGCLPQTVPFRDAVHNLSRAALFSSSLLTGKYENLKTAVGDALHQPYRLPLIPHAENVFAKCYELGAYAVYISGAGPTIMGIVDGANREYLPLIRQYLVDNGLCWSVQNLEIDNFGTQISHI